MPIAPPSTAPTTPTTAPFATMTSRTSLSVAPSEDRMPSERSRRWASTVKPATATSPMKNSPTTANASAITAGVSPLGGCGRSGVVPGGKLNVAKLSGVASKSTVTWVGLVTCPGATSANVSSRFCGFSTIPVTRSARPSMRQVPPIPARNADASPLVRSTSPGPCG